MLWLYQRTFFGEAAEAVQSHMPDLTAREWAAILPLIVLMVWMGIASPSLPAADQRHECAHPGAHPSMKSSST